MRNVIKVFVLVDANERYIKRIRACHRDVSESNFRLLSVIQVWNILEQVQK